MSFEDDDDDDFGFADPGEETKPTLPVENKPKQETKLPELTPQPSAATTNAKKE